MSSLFYDHYLDLTKIERKIQKIRLTHRQKLKIWQAVDALAFHHVLAVILANLPQKHHHRFFRRLRHAPHRQSLMKFLEKHSAVGLKSELSQASLVITTEVLTLLES